MTLKPTLVVVACAFTVVVCLAGTNVIQQTIEPIPQILAPKAKPGVFIKDNAGKTVPLKIQKLNIDVKITGPIATTTVDMTVYNPHNTVLEGEFEMPVADGQTVSRFALDINDHLREGVVVEKEKGRAVFEEIVRNRVDPALLELTKGNTFKSRIYPLPANGTRRIVIAFEQELSSSPDGFSYSYPLEYSEPVGTFDLNVSVASFGKVPSLAGNELEQVTFTPAGRTFAAELHKTNFSINRTFRCAVPIVIKEPLISTSTYKNRTYFTAFIPVASHVTVLPAPRSITLFWDASLSGKKRDTESIFTLLGNYFSKVPNTTITFQPFDIVLRKPATYTITNGDWVKLRSAIMAEPNDGATRLSCLPLTSTASDLSIIVTDGISTIGNEAMPHAMNRVVTISSSQTANYNVLRTLTEGTAGQFIDLAKCSHDEAVTKLTTGRTSASIDKAVDLSNVMIKGNPTDGMLTASGILDKGFGVFKLMLHTADGKMTSSDITISHTMKADTIIPCARLWARSQLDNYLCDEARNESSITEIGKQFSIVTPFTSLIVLESAADYARFKIAPPASEPSLISEYNALQKNFVRDSALEKNKHDSNVKHYITELTKWHTEAQKAQPMHTTTKKAKRDAGASGAYTLQSAASGSGSYRNGNSLAATPTVASTNTNATSASRSNTTTTVVSELNSVDSFNDNVSNGDGPDSRRQAAAAPTVAVARSTPRAVEVSRGATGHGSSLQIVNPGSVQRLEEREVDDRAVRHVAVDADIAGAADGRILKYSEPDTVYSIAKPLAPQFKFNGDLTNYGPISYRAYIEQQSTVIATPAYYMQTADALLKSTDTLHAIRVLSNLAEMQSENARYMRILGHRLLQLHHPLAISVFRDVVRMRGEEPQSYRDLALALDAFGDHAEAAGLLHSVIDKIWDARFPEVELIVHNELAHILTAHPELAAKNTAFSSTKCLPVDLRVVVSWDADNTDMDLWVTDPNDIKCYYGNRFVGASARLSSDMTGGYGPEEYMLCKASEGEYQIDVNYFGDRQQTIKEPTTITIDIYTNYGRPNEKKQSITRQVSGQQQVLNIGTIHFASDASSQLVVSE